MLPRCYPARAPAGRECRHSSAALLMRTAHARPSQTGTHRPQPRCSLLQVTTNRYRGPTLKRTITFGMIAQKQSGTSVHLPTPRQRYSELLQSGGLQANPAQQALVAQLDALHQQLQNYNPVIRKPARVSRSTSNHSPPKGTSRPSAVSPMHLESSTTSPRGIHLFGDVGSGKTMLMDLLFDTLPTRKKRRVHLHTFMIELHQLLHEWHEKHKGVRKARDPMVDIAYAFAKEATVLYIDEFQLNDPVDVALLTRLLVPLVSQYGTVLLTTSNRGLSDFGQNAASLCKLCAPLLQALETAVVPVQLQGTDYRTLGLRRPKEVGVYLHPLNGDTSAELERLFQKELNGRTAGSMVIKGASGRAIHVSRAAEGVAFFTFDELCRHSLGAADYYALAEAFPSVFVAGIPQMDSKSRDEARRFITLVDELYNARTKLVCSAAAPPADLFRDPLAYSPNIQELEIVDELQQNLFVAVPQWNREKFAGFLISAQEASFMFQRAISRLLEMGGHKPP